MDMVSRLQKNAAEAAEAKEKREQQARLRGAGHAPGATSTAPSTPGAGAAAAPSSGLREYRVEVVRSKLIGDRMDAKPVQDVLDRYAKSGWRFMQAVETEVKGRVGPGGTMGLMLFFER